jgi:type IV secretion system protein VirD4
VGAYIAETPQLSFSLGVIYAELSGADPKSRLRSILTARAESNDPLSPGCVNALSDFCSASENTFASIKLTITSRLNLWLNPRVCAATQVSDFDLRDLRSARMSLYLCTSLDNLTRVEPLYNLLLQQLVDFNTRERPTKDRHTVKVLMVLDEFARIGHAGVIAHGFAYVAGYGLRLLPVLQSPAQLRAEYGQDLAEEIISNCGVEIAFAPKELKVAQDLSERLGFWTYLGRSRSRPTGLSGGRRSATESDQRRALMMPQELMMLPADQLIVLRAGMAPVRGRKIAYWRERAFAARVCSPPDIQPYPGFGIAHTQAQAAASLGDMGRQPDRVGDELRLAPLNLDADVARPDPLPLKGASDSEIEALVGFHLEDTGRHGRHSS